jgi:hypothetical protein
VGGTYLQLNPEDIARVLQPGQRLELILNRHVDSGNRMERITVPARILSFEAGVIKLLLAEEGRPWFSLFRPGRLLTIQTGRSNSLFTFKSKIIGREVLDGVQITLESPRILASAERRQRPRVPIMVPVVYRLLSFRDKKLQHLAEKIGTGASGDLNNQGITLLTDLQLPVGMTILVEFNLEGEAVSLLGVVRRTRSEKKKPYAYSVGVQFLEPGFEHQEMILRAINKVGERFKGGITI